MKKSPQLTKKYLPAIVIFVFAAAIYLNILPNGFVHDDNFQIIENHWIRSASFVPDVLFSNTWGFADFRSNYYRPVMYFVYMADYALFGLNPWGYHLTTLLINALTSVLVFFVSLHLLILQSGRGKNPKEYPNAASDPRMWGAFLAALIFAAHPIHTETVAWAACVPELTLALFYLLSLYLYMRYKSSGRTTLYSLSVISFFIAALSKEPALTLPALLILYDILVEREPVKPLLPWVRRYLPYGVAAILYMALRIAALRGFAPTRGGGAVYGLSTAENLLNSLVLLFDYARAMVLPSTNNFFHTFVPVRSPLEAHTLLAIAFTIGTVLVMRQLSKGNRAALLSVFLLLLPLTPVLYVPWVGENVFAERYAYLPSAGAALLVGFFLNSVFAAPATSKRTLATLIFAIVALGAFATIQRSFDFRNDFTIWYDTVEKSPENGYVHRLIVDEYLERGDSDSAVESYRKAMSAKHLPLDKALGHYNIGNIFSREGELYLAKKEYLSALEADPEYYMAWNNLGSVYAMQGHVEEAIESFRRAVKIDSERPEARENLAKALRLKP